ncbi:MAG: SAM-dependent chlorinase/fluorinase [Coriobacteriaceae bacterium]|nr:SAM-dependent chlorinase/fluorinase [Coriobacteriaceae bacterium]
MKPTVVFMTDFGSGGGAVLAGVVKSVDPELGVYDFDHNIEPYNIRQAAYQLSTVVPFWPAGTVFVSVVDPGVGTDRRGCIARLENGSYVVTPDNGTLTMVAGDIVEIREIDQSAHRLPGSEDVHIFHGRDVFSFTAARLASGAIAFTEVGPAYPVSEVVRLALTNVKPLLSFGWAEGGVYNFDLPYGSARINIRNRDFQQLAGFSYGDLFHVTVHDGDRLVFEGEGRYGRTFGDVEDREAQLVGDIQLGASQMLRFNTRGNFIREHAPEVERDQSLAVNFRFRFERAS